MGQVEMEVHRHGLMMLASSTVITFIGFFVTMFYAHWLGAEILGYYFLFLSFYNILGLFSDLGINYASLKRISEGIQQNAYFTLSLLLRLMLFALVSILLVIFRDHFVDLNNAGLFWILIIAFGIGTLASCLGAAIAAANRLGLAASMSILENVTRIGVQFAGVLLGFKVLGLAGGVIAGLTVEIAIALKYIDFRLVQVRLEHIRSLLHYSLWASLASYGVAVMDNINVILIGYFMTTSDVGIFGICWAFSFFGLFVSTALCNTLWVKVSRWSASGERETIALALSRACSYALLFAIPILVGGVLLGEDLLYYLYSASFTAGFGALVILLFARTMQSVYQIFYTFLMAMDAARDAFFVVLGGSAVNIILAMVLIPMVGLVGAAAGTLVTAGISLVLAYRILRRHSGVSLEVRAIMRFLGAAGIMGGVLVVGKALVLIHAFWKPVLLVLLGAGVYFGILLLIDSRLRDDARRTFMIRWEG
ncbi:MAG: polysaccharide biosynthesis C-terminal domain-containing protein [Methanomicrobiales archaeon]|nr:polysaccharide biosynthesis C-terminal domain-containing protein [Methanomicrobiales archaeon]